MKDRKQERKKRVSHPALLVLEILLAGVALFSLYKVGSILMEYRNSAQSYEAIRAEVTQPTGDKDTSGEPTEEAERQPVDFALLQEKYPGAVGWITCADTVIDYPIMQAKDNDYFLRRLPSGEWNIGGSLFLDYRSQSDFLGPLSLIYGHHMNDNSMFAQLDDYKKHSFYKSHRFIKFYSYYKGQTIEKNYEIALVFKTVAYSDKGFKYYSYTNFSDIQELNEFLSNCKNLQCYDTGVDINYGDKLITLSTCEYSQKNGRMVIVAKQI